MPENIPILIIGGFGASWQAYEPLRHILESITQRRVYVTRLVTLDWLGVIVSDDYTPLLKKLHISVNETLRRTRAQQLMVVAHSAGGILARIYMGDQPYGSEQLVFHGFQRVTTLITLGTPHTTTKQGRSCGLNQISFAQTHYPGAYWRFIRYVTVISKGIQGIKDGERAERSAWESYVMLSASGEQWGDGVVPLSCGLLDGAEHVVLEGLRHDPLPDTRVWYGHNEEIVRSWWHTVEPPEPPELPEPPTLPASAQITGTADVPELPAPPPLLEGE